MKSFNRILATFCLSLAGVSMSLAYAEAEARANANPGMPPQGDVIARVDDQAITFSQINTMLNSSAVVGVSVPALGTPERDTARIVVLDKVISANLLYLDALQQGVDQDPDYQQAVQQFRDSILANLYRSRYLVGEIEVTDQEIDDFYQNNIVAGTELTDEHRLGIEEDMLPKLSQQEIDWYQEMLEKAQKSPEEVIERLRKK